jgi:hypothetical protein
MKSGQQHIHIPHSGQQRHKQAFFRFLATGMHDWVSDERTEKKRDSLAAKHIKQTMA